jgi:RNA polymerase sigma factor (sigma-70 family)
MPELGYASLYTEHLTAARRTALSLVPPDAADDIVAEAFTRVLAAMRAGGGPAGAFRPYLLAAVRNIARDWLAERRRTVPAADPAPRRHAPAAGDLAVLAEEREMVGRAFGTLSPRWRQVLWLTEVEGFPVTSLATEWGLSPAAVSQLAWRARIGLAQAWQRERGTQERVTGPVPALRLLADRKNPR